MKGNGYYLLTAAVEAVWGIGFTQGQTRARGTVQVLSSLQTVFLKKLKASNLAFELGRLNTNILFCFTCPPVLKVVARKV